MSSDTKAAPNKKAAPKKKVEKPVMFPDLEAKLYLASNENGPITVDHAKGWLGWTEEPEDGGWEDNFLLKDESGKKIRCTYNAHNRPFTESWSRTLARDILNRNWADSRNGGDLSINGETVIIGRSGAVLSAQHRLIGLILAEQIRTSEDEDAARHWAEKWDGPVTMEGLVVFGVSEDERVVRTIDNVRPRSLSDVLYTEGTFAKKGLKARKKLCNMLDQSVRYVWDRLGMGADAWAVGGKSGGTHSESLDFVRRHKTLVECVEFVYGINGEKGVSRYVPPGLAAGMCYLMALSDSDGEEYHARDNPSEALKCVSKARLDTAKEFWKDVTDGVKSGPVRTALARSEGKWSLGELSAIIVRAWLVWKDGGEFSAASLSIADLYEGGVLKRYPSFGGIDLPERDTTAKEEDEERDAAAEAESPDVPQDESEGEGVSDSPPEPTVGAGRATPAKKKGTPKRPDSAILEAQTALQSEYPGCVCLYLTDKGYVGYGDDAVALAAAQGGTETERDGVTTFAIPRSDEEITLGELHRTAPVFVYSGEGFVQWVPADVPVESESAPEPTPETGRKPAPKKKFRPKPASQLRGGTN